MNMNSNMNAESDK